MTSGQRAALKKAANILSRKSYSKQELYDKLIKKDIVDADAAFAIAKMSELHALDDMAYGQMLARNYFGRGYGASRVRQVLIRHKIDRDLIDEILSDPRESTSEIEAFIKSKLKGISSPDRKDFNRIANALIRRGFSWNEISPIIQRFSRLEDHIDSF